MLSRFINLIIALLTITPLLVLVIINNYIEFNKLYFYFILIASIVIPHIMIIYILNFSARQGNRFNISITNVELADSELVSSYIGLFIPLLWSLNQEFIAFHIGSLLIYGILIFKSNIWYYNPIFRLLSSFKVYKVQNNQHITFYMLSKESLPDIINTKKIIKMNDNILIGL